VYFTTSWDDGHPFDLRVAEMLAKYGVDGTFYVPRANVEGRAVMTSEELRTIANEFEIGGHTLDHVRLHESSSDTRRQILEGKQRVEDEIGRSIVGFCYPGGVHTLKIREHVRDCGFRYARTIVNFQGRPTNDPFRVPTTIQLFPHHRFTYAKNFVRGRAWSSRSRLFAISLTAPSLDRLLGTLLDEVEAEDGIFHLWGHSWELEEHGLWPALERLLALVEKRVPRDHRVTNAALYAKV
jgi:peptidoglycan/xylan/chitin deacetylase (PgdA/CDA1 family)